MSKLIKQISIKEVYPFLILIFFFIISRIMFYTFLGLNFITKPLFHRQAIDVPLLQNKLLESIFYLHSQPPLYNLFLGVVLKIFPENYGITFRIIYFILGLILTISLYALLKRFKVNQKLSVVLVIFFIVSPSIILFEILT